MSDSGPKDRVGLPQVATAAPNPEADDGLLTMDADDFVELQPTDPSTQVDNVDDFVSAPQTMYAQQPERVALLRATKRWRVVVIAGTMLIMAGTAAAVLWYFRRRLGIG